MALINRVIGSTSNEANEVYKDPHQLSYALLSEYDLPIQACTARKLQRSGDIQYSIQSMTAEFSHDDWDGERASAISLQAFHDTKLLLESLPDAIPLPNIGADPDGAVELFWSANSERLTLSIFGDGEAVIVGKVAGKRISRTDRLMPVERLLPSLSSYLGQMYGMPSVTLKSRA